MFRAFIIIDEGHPTLVAELESILREMFRERRLNGTAKWYYDEFVEPTEYGVRIDVSDISAAEWQGLLEAILQFVTGKYGEASVEVS